MPKSATAPVPGSTGRLGRLSAGLQNLHARLRRPVASGSYNAEIDGLRFFAIAIVVVGHYMERAVRFFPEAGATIDAHPLFSPLLRPGLGVYLFFAISGFIIAGQFLKAKASPLSGRFLKAYFGRRILRIEPPYIVLLVSTWLLICASGYKPDQTNHFDAMPNSLGVSLVGSVFYLHDLLWGTYPRLFPPGWSLEVEVQFYLVAPLLFWAYFGSRSLPVKMVLGAAGLLGGAYLSVRTPQHLGDLSIYTSILRFFQYFWLGILLADLRGWIAERTMAMPSVIAGMIGWLGLVVYFTMPFANDDHLVAALITRFAMLATLTAMFVSVLSPASSFRSFCARPWISLIGGACYSLYLTHVQTIQAVTSIAAKTGTQRGLAFVLLLFVVEMVAVIGVGLTFYALVERTFMIKDWPGRFLAWSRRLVATPQMVAGKPISAREGE